MKQVINVHWFKTPNIGDVVCGPADYFSFGLPTKKVDIKEVHLISKEEWNRSFVIVGGGGHIHLPSPEYMDGTMEHLHVLANLSYYSVLWGVGHNVHWATLEQVSYPHVLFRFALRGVRDAYLPSHYEFVPCVSCMSPLFDKVYKIKHDIAYFLHQYGDWYGDDVDYGYGPIKFCELSSFEEVVEHIGQCKILVTDSYHGAYWATLMGKIVILDNVHSSRFLLIPANQGIIPREGSNPMDIPIKEAKALYKFMRGVTPFPATGLLKRYREINRSFHRKVLALIEEYKQVEQ